MVFSNSQKSSPTLKQLSSYLVDIMIPKIAKNQNFTAVTYVEPKFSDNLAGDKRRIVLNISVLQQTIAARSYEKTYNLAGIPTS